MNENSSLHLYFMEKDERYTVNNVVIDDTVGNYISSTYLTTPVYDLTKKEIGYNVTNRHIDQNGDKYVICINSTYYIYGKGSISWQYVFEHDSSGIFYPEGGIFYPEGGIFYPEGGIFYPMSGVIDSTLGDYYGKNGTISLFSKEDGLIIVKIVFNN